MSDLCEYCGSRNDALHRSQLAAVSRARWHSFVCDSNRLIAFEDSILRWHAPLFEQQWGCSSHFRCCTADELAFASLMQRLHAAHVVMVSQGKNPFDAGTDATDTLLQHIHTCRFSQQDRAEYIRLTQVYIDALSQCPQCLPCRD